LADRDAAVREGDVTSVARVACANELAPELLLLISAASGLART
jgi:hypothetical protein